MKLPKVSGGVSPLILNSNIKKNGGALPSWPSISIPSLPIPIPPLPIPIPGTGGGGGHASYSNDQLKRFAVCMGFPNTSEASQCLGAVLGCAPTAAAGPAYGVCVGAICGHAGAKHGYRCAEKVGLI
jgi:hypothetical protein